MIINRIIYKCFVVSVIADVLDEARLIDIERVMNYIVFFTDAIYTSWRYSVVGSPILVLVFPAHGYKCISCQFELFTIHADKVINHTCPGIL